MIYATQPWRVEVEQEGAVIEAYVESTNKWESVAIVLPTSGASAGKMARFIVGLVNDNQKETPLLENALAALESVSEEGLTFASEQAVEHAIADLRKRREAENVPHGDLDRMVAAIADRLQESGSCKPHELNGLGFSRDEIARYWPMAYALACVSLDIEPKDS
jgi:hypothetical protein